MKRLAPVAVVLAVFASVAPAALCRKCKGQMYIMSVGSCTLCANHTTSGAHKLCRTCSAKRKQCEDCRGPLGAAGPVRPRPPARPPAKSPTPPGAVVLTESSDGKKVRVGLATRFYVKLKVDPVLRWGMEPLAGRVVAQEGKPRHLPLLGSDGRPIPTFAPSGHMLYTLKAAKLGSQTLKFKLLARPGRPTRRQKTFTVTIEVAKGAPAPPPGTGADQPKPSPPVVKDGLSLSVKPVKAVFARREPIVLEVTIKNVGKKPITLAGTRFLRWRPSPGLAFVVTDLASKQPRTLNEGTNPMIRAPVRLENKTLAPAATLLVRASLDRWSWHMAAAPARPGAKGRKVRQYLGPDVLPGGTYTIVVRCKLGEGYPKTAVFWTGEIEAKPVSLKVDPTKVAGTGRETPGAGWTQLYADEAWYKRRKGPEKQFSGTLQAVPQAGGASTLMRAAFYRLGRWRLYTAARKHPALDKLVGKPVQIRGKEVRMNLEGRNLQEIWPASIRRIRPFVSTPVAPKVSPPLRSIVRPARTPTGQAKE
jgi:hypothetical protein